MSDGIGSCRKGIRARLCLLAVLGVLLSGCPGGPFNPNVAEVSVSIVGDGTVTITSDGTQLLQCSSGTCARSFDIIGSDDDIGFSAEPADGWQLDHWETQPTSNKGCGNLSQNELHVFFNDVEEGAILHCMAVFVRPEPTGEFTISRSPAVADDVVSFDATASTDSDGQILTYEWDFGDAGGALENLGATPTHAYTQAGTYDVLLRVTDDDGLQDEATAELTVHAAPEAVVTLPASLLAGPITFDGSSSTPAAEIVQYDWGIDPCPASAAACTATGAQWQVDLTEDAYVVSLTITLSINPRWTGQSAATTEGVEVVTVLPPVASFTFHDQLVDAPPVNTISVDRSASQNAVNWEWMLQHRVSAAEPFVTIDTSGELTVPTYDFVTPPLVGQFWIFLTVYNAIDDADQMIQATVR